MKLRLVILTFVAFVALAGFAQITLGTAQAQASDECVHQPTISSLKACVQHAAAQGFIDNQGVTNSLLAKLDSAQAALDRGQTSVAIHKLEAFVHEVQAQAGKHIIQEHAQDLEEHAQLVIQALRG